MREKLIELLGEMHCGHLDKENCETCDHRYEENCAAAAFADHLLANGVIVLPCKVGDTVWRVRPELCVYRENDACDNYCDGFDTFCEEYEGGKFIEHSKFSLSMLDSIGKTVFLTKEEAEAAAKEEQG